MNITEGDVRFIRKVLLPRFKVSRVYLGMSDSKKRWPDLWLSYKNGIPMITVTEEWKSHSKDLRRSQLVHEFLHIKGLEHGVYDGLNYDTHPENDQYSKKVYRELVKI